MKNELQRTQIEIEEGSQYKKSISPKLGATDVLDCRRVQIEGKDMPLRQTTVVWDPVTEEPALQIKVVGEYPGKKLRLHTFTLVGEEINDSPFAVGNNPEYDAEREINVISIEYSYVSSDTHR